MSGQPSRPRPPIAPSGEQFTIARDEQSATIVEVGGGIRAYAVGARDVLEPYAVEAMCDGAHGTPLIPWPNRLADGRYSFDGREHQLALTEPARHNAIHGLLRWRAWRAVERKPDHVVMGVRLHPLTGYPFALDVRIGYELGADGLTVTTSATNVGGDACPFGAGQHPYLSPGAALLDTAELQVPARTRILTDPDRSLPVGREPVAGDSDFRRSRSLGATRLDSAFTDLERDGAGLATTRLRGADGRTVELWQDERYPYIQVFTGDGLAPERRRRGLGVEPTSCPPNAFASGEDVVRLDPGMTFTARWGVRLV